MCTYMMVAWVDAWVWARFRADHRVRPALLGLLCDVKPGVVVQKHELDIGVPGPPEPYQVGTAPTSNQWCISNKHTVHIIEIVPASNCLAIKNVVRHRNVGRCFQLLTPCPYQVWCHGGASVVQKGAAPDVWQDHKLCCNDHVLII